MLQAGELEDRVEEITDSEQEKKESICKVNSYTRQDLEDDNHLSNMLLLTTHT